MWNPNVASHSKQKEFESIDVLEKELTQKFLRGDISFAEYSNEWYDKDEEDDGDGIEEEEEVLERELQEPEVNSHTPPKAKNTKRRKRRKLTAALEGLMGEANIRFVRGEAEVAKDMCYEIIKQVPNAPEPYQTLAQIYENDPDKSFHFSLLAAHLSPSDAQEWLRLAAIAKERHDVRQEMICYSMAIKADPQNLELHLKRIDLLNFLENTDFPFQTLKVTHLICYHKMVTLLPATEGTFIMDSAKKAARMYHSNNEIDKAYEVMSVAYSKCSNLFSLEDVNLYLELLIAQQQFQTCLEVFVANVGVAIEAEIHTVMVEDIVEEQTNYISCTIPDNIPIDLRCKLLVCFIFLGANNLVQLLLTEFLKNDVEKAGDLYMDLEEAFSSHGQYENSLKLLELLLKNEHFNMGAVWLKYAECLSNLERYDEAINAYQKVLAEVPQHTEARERLYAIMAKKGSIDDALQALEQPLDTVVNGQLLYRYCLELKKYNKKEKYLEMGEALLSKTFWKYRNREELRVARIIKGALETLHNLRESCGENPIDDNRIQFEDEQTFNLSQSEEWELFKDLLATAYHIKKFYVMQRLAYGAMQSKQLFKYRQDIEVFCIHAALLNNDCSPANPMVKDITAKLRTTNAFNFLNLIAHVLYEYFNIKYLIRLLVKSNEPCKNTLMGNNSLSRGRFITALKYYMDHYEQNKDALTALSISVALFSSAIQRTVDKTHNLVLQGMNYLMQYKKLRNCDQEFYFNMGRAFHMLNINNLACEYYEKALVCPPPVTCDKHGTIDLTRETAYNLYLIYRVQSPYIATRYLYKYLVI